MLIKKDKGEKVKMLLLKSLEIMVIVYNNSRSETNLK